MSGKYRVSVFAGPQYQNEKKAYELSRAAAPCNSTSGWLLGLFFILLRGWGQKLKTTLYKTPGLIRGREVRPILRLKLNNFLSSSSRQQYREGPVGDHECYMSDEAELQNWQKEILILRNESFSPLEV